MNRRRFLKYVGVTAVVAGTSAVALDYWRSQRLQNLSQVTSSETSSSMVIQSSTASKTSTLESTLADLDDPKSGYPQLANELRNLPDFHLDTVESRTAVRRIATLALQSDNSEVREAFEVMLRGGTPNPNDYHYAVPSWNTELQVLFWLGEQNEFKRNDTLAQAIAMVNGLWISLGTDEVKQAVYKDSNDLLKFFKETNEIQKASNYPQLGNYPLEALVALAWTGNDLGRGGHIHYRLETGGPSYSTPINVHHFIENTGRRVDLKDYQWNTVSVDTLREMRNVVSGRGWLDYSVDKTDSNLESYLYVGPKSPGFDLAHWKFTEPKDDFIVVNGERTVNHNMNNSNFEFQYFKENQGGIGVCDDDMALTDAFLKSRGIASTALVRMYGTQGGLNHTHVVYYEPISKVWKANSNQIRVGSTNPAFSTNWNVYVFRPPVLQHNYFYSQYDNKQTYMIMLDLYYKMMGAASDRVTDMFSKGVPTSVVHEWFLSKS